MIYLYKRAIICLVLVLTSLAHAQPLSTAPVAGSHTLLLWHFDEGTGDQAKDASGHVRDGKIAGATWVEGRFGQALRWGEDSGSVVGPTDLPELKDAFTLSMWVKLDKMPTGKIPFWTADVGGKLGSMMITIRPPGLLYVGLQLGGQPNHLMGQTQIELNQWTHVALTYDGAAGKIGLFVNGKLDTEYDVALGSPLDVNPSKTPFFVRSYNGGDEKLVGSIDEVCLTNIAETYGHKWRSNVYLHLLRYQSAFLVGAAKRRSGPDPVREYQLLVKDAQGKTVVGLKLRSQEVGEGVLVPAPGLKAGEYQAKVTALRTNGATETLLEREIAYTPPVKSVVSLTDQNVCLVQGKPFFPIGAYHVRQGDFATVKAGGFNTVFCYTTTVPPGAHKPSDGVGYIEKCGEYGLKGIGLGGVNEAILTHYRSNPNLLFWYIADEPSGPIDPLMTRYETWAAVDPTHPYFLLQNKPAEFMRHAAACDIYATDPYPIRFDAQADLTHVARYTEGAVAAVFNRKPVWVALQCYTVKAVSEAGKPSDGRPRLPTQAELRCMSYMALACGARGLLYYAFDDTYYNNGSIRGVNIAKEYPEFWAQMTEVLKEIGAQEKVWVAPYATLRPVADTPDIIVQERPFSLGGKTYVLVVNPKYEAREVRVKLPGCKAKGAAQDALGGKAGMIESAILTDRLEALESKCYVIGG